MRCVIFVSDFLNYSPMAITIRLILTTIILTMLAQPAIGNDLGKMYEVCKPFANTGYDLDSLGSDFWKGIACSGYVKGATEMAQAICRVSSDEATKFVFGMDTELSNLNAVMQSLVNFEAANPQLCDVALPAIKIFQKDPLHQNHRRHPTTPPLKGVGCRRTGRTQITKQPRFFSCRGFSKAKNPGEIAV